MKKTTKASSFEELVPDAELREKMKAHLYAKKSLFGEGSIFSELLQSAVNGMLNGEMTDFLEEERAKDKPNKRNGHTKKVVRSMAGPLEIQTPRDRLSDFEPELISKRERELSSGMDEQILALYAQGNSVEDVRRLVEKIYGVSISAGKISAITDQVLPEIERWRNRPLRSFYAIIYLDAIHFKIRHEGVYSSRAFYTVYGVDAQGERDLLGLYINESEGARAWGAVLQDIKKRGVEDVLVFCTDDLKGFSEAIDEVYPASIIQKCIVHKVRSSTRFCDDKDVRAVRQDLRAVYTATTRSAAELALEAFDAKWKNKYADITQSWRRDWDELMAFMDYPPAMQRMIYTTNPVEALHRIVRKLIKGKAAWVSDTALLKQLYLSLQHNEKSWKRKANGWKTIQRELIKLYGDRISKHLLDQ